VTNAGLSSHSEVRPPEGDVSPHDWYESRPSAGPSPSGTPAAPASVEEVDDDNTDEDDEDGAHVTPAVPMCAVSRAESHQLGDCLLTLLIQRLDGANEHLSLDRVDAYQSEAVLAR
jgi:hypothetical protein